jgi:cephalosporin hydroxylase
MKNSTIFDKFEKGILYAWSYIRPVPKDERVSFSVRSVVKGHYKITYRGVPAQKCPFDYVLYQMIINEIKPDLIIEVGTNNGGGCLYMADMLDIIGEGTIHTIDIEDKVPEIVRNHPRIKRFTKGWEGYSVDNAKGYKKILVIEDGSHTYEDTIGAMNKLAHLVSVGSYLIVEDGIVSALGTEGSLNGGPLKALREFLPKNKNFTNDTYFSNMFGENATFNVNGYLKKTA